MVFSFFVSIFVAMYEREDLQRALEVLRQGGVILYPTDTVWGIGCDATNAEAVRRIYEIKRREEQKAMLVLLDNVSRLEAYVDEVPDMAWDLVELAVKPLTIIYPEAKNLADNLIGEDKSIGIRITREKFSAALCGQLRKPLVSTSANISGEKSPGTFGEISEEVKNAVDYVVKYRQEETGGATPSSIIKLGKGNMVSVIRE